MRQTVLIRVEGPLLKMEGEYCLEDEKIVALYVQKDETAIKWTSEKYGQRLRALSLRIVDDWQTAEECENDTYMGAWNSIPPHEPKNYLYAFLARITRHLSLNCCRERRRLKRSAFISELSAEMEQCIPAPDDVECHMDRLTLQQAINGFLGTLSVEKRNVFLRRYWYLDSVAAISKRYALSESKVKTMLFRMRNQLRKYFEQEGYDL